MDIKNKIKTIEQTFCIKLLNEVQKYGNEYVELFRYNKRVVANYINKEIIPFSKESERTLIEMQQNIVLGWIIEDFVLKELGATLNGCDKNRKFEGEISTEPDLILLNGIPIEVKASYKNEIKEHERFYIKQHSLQVVQKRNITLCIVDVVNGSYQLINPVETNIIGSAICHGKVWLHLQVDKNNMHKFKGG